MPNLINTCELETYSEFNHSIVKKAERLTTNGQAMPLLLSTKLFDVSPHIPEKHSIGGMPLKWISILALSKDF